MANVTSYTVDGVSNIKEVIRLLVNDLTGSGVPAAGTASEHMKIIYPTDGSIDFTDSSAWPDDVLVILEATTDIDPFANPEAGLPTQTEASLGTDPWRIAFHTSMWTGRSTYSSSKENKDTININSLALYVGTPSTLSVDVNGIPSIGWLTTTTQKPMAFAPSITYPYQSTYIGKDLVEPLGNVGAQWTNTFDPTANATKFGTPPSGVYTSPSKFDGPDTTDPGQLFVNKYVTAGPKATFGGFAAESEVGQPNSYRVVLTDHGLFIGIWGPDPEENGKGFSWVLVQRPVDKKTGIVRGLDTITGQPLTGTEVDASGNPIPIGNRPLFCVNSTGGQYWKFIVREHDTPVPSARKDATVNAPDSGAVINPYQQQSLTENGEYVITFLNNLNTSRFKYSDELDMLGTVSSDVVGGGSQINVNVYSEVSKRVYHALWSSGSFGTKMRIMIVADIPTPTRPWVSDEPTPEPTPEPAP
jgi:hypothetical protein